MSGRVDAGVLSSAMSTVTVPSWADLQRAQPAEAERGDRAQAHDLFPLHRELRVHGRRQEIEALLLDVIARVELTRLFVSQGHVVARHPTDHRERVRVSGVACGL